MAAFKGGDPGGMEIVAFALSNGQTSLAVFNLKQTEQSFQVDADGKFFSYTAPKHSIATFVW